MIKKILGLSQKLCYYSNFYKILNSFNKDKIRVLMYHSINGSDSIPDYLKVSEKNFEKQMKFLKENYNVISYKDFDQRFRTGEIEPNTVLITFDDGYKDNCTYAYPILKRFNLPAIMFLTSNRDGPYLSDNDIEFMSDLISFGYHTKSHKRLSELTLNELEEELKSNYEVFAYPYGDKKSYNKEVIEEVKKDYLFAFTTTEGLVSDDSDPYKLERLSITDMNLPEFVSSIEGFNKFFINFYKIFK